MRTQRALAVGVSVVALRNVAVNMVPNVLFRNADYIYGD